MPTPESGQSMCVARFQNGATVNGVLAGRDASNIEFEILLTTRVGTGLNNGGAASGFTYANDLGGAAPQCTQSFGAGTVNFNTSGRTNEASGVYRDSTNPSLIVGARGTITYSWRAVGTVMAFTITGINVEAEIFRPTGNIFKTVMAAPITTAGANGAGVFLPMTNLTQAAIDCASSVEGTSPMTATVAWNLAPSGN
jgi:hypothetical protein